VQPSPNVVKEAQRLMTICNACRYCEGYCAVFPAMELRRTFTEADVRYLANLCHNCGECYHACQYAPPHEFAVNVPRAFSELRPDTYRRNASPIRVPQIAALIISAAVLLPFLNYSGQTFYAVLPHSRMTVIFGATFALAWLAMLLTHWPRTDQRGAGSQPAAASQAAFRGLSDASALPNLTSGLRRLFHHLTFYGFLLCFASTTIAAFDHYVLRLQAPYPYISAPVILGTLGGIGLLVGPAGLHVLKRRRDPHLTHPDEASLDDQFIDMLFMVSSTGLLLLALRTTPAMPSLLAAHLISVLAFFISMPYGKFVHGLYHTLALIRSWKEKLSSPVREPDA
jgi:citrate/tricarballylate utilization protein